MIARLRKKFILITMGSLVVVLVILMGFINVANFEKLDGNADQVLTILANNGGVFPDVHSMHDKTPPGSSSSSSGSSAPSKTPKPGNILGGLSPEAPYETRFFSVTLKKNGELDSINTGRIAAVSTDEAADMAKELHEEGKTSGYDGNYKYLAKKTSSGTLYVFLDCTRDLGSVKNFFFNSILVSLCGILGVFSLVVPLSRRAIQPVAESYEKQKQFITNAGHEIKTPLAIIDSCAEVLEMEQGESKWTTGIRGQVKRLTALTSSLVSLARMDEDSTTLTKTEFCLSDTVTDTLEPFILLAESNHLRLTADIQPGVTYCGSEPLLRQLCSILADNAVKYASPESEIHFSLTQKGKKIVLVSENQAENLTAGDQSVLFDRFYRGDTSHSSEKTGYGIGLSMAQSIVVSHGGKITADSDGQSLRITATL
jgi:two-component system sensor histidine kinase CiaH